MPTDPFPPPARVPTGVRFTLLAILVGVPLLVQAQARPDFEGVWSTTMTTPDDEAWNIEDYGCFLGCMPAAYERLRTLLNDPANDDRPYAELMVEAWRHGAEGFVASLTPAGLARREEIGFGDEAAIACEPSGFVRQINSPVPLEITQHDDRVILRYEEWGAVRTIYLDGRAPPEDMQPTLYGYSTGRYEGSALVIETVGIAPASFWRDHGGGGNSDRLRAVERYTRSADGSWLRLEATFEDPVMLAEPMVYRKVWRYTPDVELLEHDCETISGRP